MVFSAAYAFVFDEEASFLKFYPELDTFPCLSVFLFVRALQITYKPSTIFKGEYL